MKLEKIMDKNFFRFFEEVFRKGANENARLSAVGKLFADGSKAGGEYLDIFRKIYGSKPEKQPAADMNFNMESAMAEFKKGMAEFLSAMDVVPRSDYQALVKEHDALKKKAAEQEAVIAGLRALLEVKQGDGAAGIETFSKMVESQQELFLKFMSGMSGNPEKGEEDSTS
ncbi:MAG: hypothetical protein GXP53_05410 [Deltaproteobacteria bacterium]|nr:hypothetical protein [Deltaproteobacteria bacterium]